MTMFDQCTDATHQLDAAADDDSGYVVDRMDPSLREAQDVLSVIQVSDGDGRFVLTAAVSGSGPSVAVDIAPGTLRLLHGRVSRFIPLPDDALLDRAVIQHSEHTLTVTIPERERRDCRHMIHVW